MGTRNEGRINLQEQIKICRRLLSSTGITHVLHNPWVRCNNMTLSWLQCSILESIAHSILWIDNAHTVWKILENQFSQGDIFKISDIQDDLTRLQQGNLDIINYFTKLTSLWEQIDSFRPTRDCVCAIQCTCGDTTDLRKYKNQDRVIKFLNGLNEQFSNVRSQIMLLEPLPSLDKTFSLVLGQERQLNVQASSNSAPENQAMAMQVQNNHYNGGGRGTNNSNNRGKGHNNSAFGRGPYQNSNRICTHCGRTNHTVETCFLKHGYPPGFQQRHSRAAFNTATASDSQDSSPVDQESTDASLTIIQDQYNQILQLLQNNLKVSSSTTSIQLQLILLLFKIILSIQFPLHLVNKLSIG
ncbi:uncharacterized protein [Cicer arietinum]|uniref:Uncharacterized protein LOC101505117 n=1 Tax=Cicer arietinum TaxID=3827 RepID=A0A1S2Y260_CICAR|nr:uncharacterized protein LOC101505117 [Cicer arietinum]